MPQPDLFLAARQADAIARDPMIDAALAAGAVVVFNLSGGKDCGAAAALTIAHLDAIGHPADRRLAIHADLGRAEWLSTPAQVEAQARALGLRLVVVRANAGDLVDRFEHRWRRGLEAYASLSLYNLRGPWSSPALKFCQSEKKIQVMGPHLARAFPGQTIINVVGIRREESTARAKCEVAKLDTRFAKPGNKAGTTMMLWHPIVDVLEAEVFDINRRHDIPLAESYALGSTRHSCALCVMGSLNDLGVGATGHPWLAQHYMALEVDSTFSFQHGRWLADVVPAGLVSTGLRADVEAAKLKAAERRALELALPARHRFVKGWPLYVPTTEEALAIVQARRAILGHHSLDDAFRTPQLVRDRFAELLELKSKKVAISGLREAA